MGEPKICNFCKLPSDESDMIEDNDDIDKKFSILMSECESKRSSTQLTQEDVVETLDQISIIRWLLENATDINIYPWDIQAIVNQCELSNIDEVLNILKDYGILIKSTSTYGENNAIFSASKYGTPDILSWLVEHGAYVECYNNQNDSNLHIAIENNKLKNAIRLINLGANPNRSSILKVAVKNNYFHIVKYLIENKLIENRGGAILDAFHCAIEEQYYDIIEYFIKYDPSLITDSNYDKNISIHSAAKTGNILLIKWLLQKGAKLFVKNRNRNTVIHIAAQNGHLQLLKWLILQGGDIKERIIYGFTPLHLAASNGHFECVKFLVHQDCEVNSKDRYGKTVLHLAAESENLETVQFLVEHKSDIHACDDFKNTVLHFGIKSLNILKYLIKNGCDPYKKNIESKTVLHLASRSFLYNSVEYLLESGLSVSDTLEESNAWLQQTHIENNFDLLKLCLKYVKDINSNIVGTSKVLLHNAAIYVNITKYLIQNYHCNINITDNELNTPLIIALRHGAFASAYYLIEHGSDVHLKNINGETALYYASSHNNILLIEKLINLGADINVKNNLGYCILRSVINHRDLNTIKLLIENGADVNSKDNENIYVINIASQMGNSWDIVKFLITKGAQVNHNNSCYSLVYLAVSTEDVDLMTWLFQHGANISTQEQNSILLTCCYINGENKQLQIIQLLLEHGANINGTNYHGDTILHHSISKLKIINFLIQNGINVNIQNAVGQTALHMIFYSYNSTMYQKYIALQVLLKAGANINIKNQSGRTPLHFAVQDENDIDISKLLILKGADINSKDSQGDSILHSTENGEIALFLCDNGANINVKNIIGITVLQNAIKRAPVNCNSNLNIIPILENRLINNSNKSTKSIDILNLISVCRYFKYLDYLIDNVTDINDIDYKGQTALHHAVKKGNISLLQKIIDKGGDLFMTTRSGNNVLHLAAIHNRTSIVKYIIENIDCTLLFKTNDRSETALHIAVEHKNIEIVKLLVNHVDIDCKNNEMYTALHIACIKGNLEIVQILLKNGANVNETCKNEYTSVQLLAKHCRTDILNYLVLSNRDEFILLKRKNDTGETLLHIAVKFGKFNNVPNKIVEYLLGKNIYPIDTLDNQCNTALHHACGTFMVDIVTMLVENGANINLKNKDGNTPFHLAAKTGSIDIINYLLEKNGDTNIKNKKGNTPIHIACAHAKIKPVICLLQRGADLYLKNRKGICVVHQLAISGGRYLFGYLLENFNTTDVNVLTNKKQNALSLAMKIPNNRNKYSIIENININSRDIFGNTALHDACRYKNAGIIDILLASGADVNIQNKKGDTSMHVACKNLGLFHIELLLSHYTNMEVVNKLGWNILHSASSGNNIEVIRMLLNLIDKFTVTNNGDNILHIACKSTDATVFNWLIQNCNIIINECNNRGDNILHACLKLSHHDVNMIEFLIENGADINSRNNNGDTVLHIAVNYARIDFVNYFIQNGLDVKVSNNFGNTSLHVAAENGYLDIVKVLLQHDFDVNTVNLENCTALHLAAKHGQMSVIKYLVNEVNCDVNIKNVNNKTALELAREFAQENVVLWLTENCI